MRVLPLVMILSVVACSSSPTGYVPSKKDKKGYSDQTIDNDLRIATFQGNAETKKDKAELYAKFRAIEICHEMKKPYTHILQVKDKTFSKDIVSSTTSTPSYYYGMSPYYGGRYGMGPGMGMSYGVGTTTTRSDTYTYPMFDVAFECVDSPVDARVSLQVLSESQMREFVKDLQGAVQVDEVLSDSPNIGKIEKGDIITKAGGKRVTNLIEIFHAARENNNKPLRLEIFRNGVKKQTVVSFKDVTALVAEAQAEIIKTACKEETVKETSSLCKK